MGTTIIANVKASSFRMTSLHKFISGMIKLGSNEQLYVGTAGLISDFSFAAGLEPI